jgi:hypothetical protein
MITPRIIRRERRLREIHESRGVDDAQARDVAGRFDDLNRLGRFARCAHDLLMIAVPHKQDLVSLARVANGLGMHFGHEGARRVDGRQPAGPGEGAHLRAHPVRAEDHNSALGHIGKIVDKHGAAPRQALHHVLVVHDLVVHVDRALVDDVEHLVDHVDRHAHARAETPGIDEQQTHPPDGRCPSATLVST